MPARSKREPSHLVETVYDSNDLFASRMGVQYLLGILQRYPLLDRSTLACVNAAIMQKQYIQESEMKSQL